MTRTVGKAEVWPPLVTPFDAEGRLDDTALASLVDFYIAQGVDGFLVTGLSAEPFTLSREERARIVEVVVARVAGRVPLAVAVYPRDEGDWAAEISAAHAQGADIAVVLTSLLAAQGEPDAVLAGRLERILAETTGDLGLYEAPRPYKRLIDLGTLARAARSGRFTFLKDTSQDLDTVKARLDVIRGSRLRLYNAHMASFRDSVAAGAHGFCGLMANVFPRALAPAADPTTEKAEQLSLMLTVGDTALEREYPASAKLLLAEAYGLKLHSHARVLKRGAEPAACSGLRALHRLLVLSGHLQPPG